MLPPSFTLSYPPLGPTRKPFQTLFGRTPVEGTNSSRRAARACGRLAVALALSCPYLIGHVPSAISADRPAKVARAPVIHKDGSCWPSPPGTDPKRCPPNDPEYSHRWEFSSNIPPPIDKTKMHPKEVALGAIGFSLDTAWQHTIGRDDVVIAVLDSGVIWENKELIRKLYLNSGELPPPETSSVYDKNGDGIFNIDDYAGDSRVSDSNHNGVLDPGDLIAAFSDCKDTDGNGYPDDICGFDFFGGKHCDFEGADNDPEDVTRFGHGTGIATTAAGETNNRFGDAGVCPRCRILPVRVGDSFVVDADQWARGAVFAVRAGAAVIASAAGSYNNTPAARLAIDIAYEHGVPVIASAADEFSYHHNFPSVNNHALYVNAIRYNHVGNWRKASTFWGVNPCTNFGPRVWLTVPATTCSSGATARLAGVAGLLESISRDAGLGQLHAEEVYQVLRATADDLDNSSPDWGSIFYPAKSGFDQLYGYGRLNAARAVTSVEQKRIPPIVDLGEPRWFSVISPDKDPVVTVTGRIRVPRASQAAWRLEYALGVEPRESDYHLVASGTTTEDRDGVLGQLDFKTLPLPSGPPPRNRNERDRYSVTVRLRAIDEKALLAEARRSFFVLHDPSWKRGFPIDLGASGEAGPVVVDLDGDGHDEIVLPTADGYLTIVRWDENGPMTQRVPLDRAAVSEPPGEPSLVVGGEPPRETVIRSAAVGDLSGRGEKSIVVASREGKVYAFSSAGERLAGFPVSVLPDLGRAASPTQRVEPGILSTPVLADLDGSPGLEIVVTGLDGCVYVWRGDGALLDGFPVKIEEVAKGPGQRAKIISTPAVGDIDGDGRPEIVLGSNRVREGFTAAFAIRAEGNRHPDGPFVPGWRPFEIPAVNPELLPTVASGIAMGPVLLDINGDGDQEVILYPVTGNAILLVDQDRTTGRPKILSKYSMTPGSESEIKGMTFLAGTGSPLVADTDHDGVPELYASLLPFRMLTLRTKPGVPLDVPLALGGWKIGEKASVPMLRNYPRRMEDLMIMARPAAADVDGDGLDEVLMGSGGYLLHAFRSAGGEADGFPKFMAGWMFSAPATGDLDGDGRLDLIAVTREGYLFAWGMSAPGAGVRRVPGGGYIPANSMTR